MENFETIVWKEPRVPNGVLTDDFVMRFDRYVNWELLSQHYGTHAPLDMLRTYQHRFVWKILLQYRLFTGSFLEEMSPNFDSDCWVVLSKYQRLSENFIRNHSYNVDWDLIAKYQDVSGEFMVEFNLHPPATSGASRNSA